MDDDNMFTSKHFVLLHVKVFAMKRTYHEAMPFVFLFRLTLSISFPSVTQTKHLELLQTSFSTQMPLLNYQMHYSSFSLYGFQLTATVALLCLIVP